MKCILVGCGGHARSLVEATRGIAGVEILGIVDANPALAGCSVLGLPVLGGDDILTSLHASGVNHFLLGVGSVGIATKRAEVARRISAMGLKPLTIVDRSAIVATDVVLSAGCQVLAGATIGSGVHAAEGAIVNTGAVVEHDCSLGSYCHVSSGAVLAGNVRVGSCAHVGAGAVVRESVVIGEGSVVGIGAAVIEDVPPSTIVAGVPARFLSYA